ncbi:MAG: pilus assembly protein PilM [Caldiserica bacterium]|nr:pilus assembly protein PilM [Caldisericota bacterium]
MAKIRHIVSADIGNYSVKLIEIRGNQVLNFGYREIDPSLEGEDRRIAWRQSLASILEVMKPKTRLTVLSFSSPNIYIRNLTYPPIPEEDLWIVMEKDAHLHLPPSHEEVIFDFSLKKEKQEEREYQVVYCNVNEVEERAQLLEEFGFKILSIVPYPYALSYSTLHKKTAGVRAVLDIGANFSTLALAKNKELQIGVQIPIGGSEFTRVIAGSLNIPFLQAEELKKKEDFLSPSSRVFPSLNKIVEQLKEEISLSLSYYSQQSRGERIEEVFFTGGGSKLKNLDSLLQEKLGIKLYKIDTLENVDTSSLRLEKKEYLHNLSPQFTALLGASMGYQELPNLRRRTEEKRKREEKARLGVLLFILGLISFTVLSFTPLLIKSFQWNQEIKINKERIQKLLPIMQEVKRVEKEKQAVENKIAYIKKSLQNKGTPWEKFASNLSLTIPEGVWINRMEYNGNKKITLWGSCFSGDKVAMWLEKLKEKSPNATPRIITLEKRKGGNLSDFQIEIVLNNG